MSVHREVAYSTFGASLTSNQRIIVAALDSLLLLCLFLLKMLLEFLLKVIVTVCLVLLGRGSGLARLLQVVRCINGLLHLSFLFLHLIQPIL